MKKITLTNGMAALVDDEDFLNIKHLPWFSSRNKERFYPATCIKTRKGWKHFRMSRLLLNPKRAEVVHHKNGNTLDNRRANLLCCSASENLRGYRKAKSKKAHSRFRGVTWNKTVKKFSAGIRLHLGYFSSQEDAARAYDKKARELFGEFASPNFPL